MNFKPLTLLISLNFALPNIGFSAINNGLDCDLVIPRNQYLIDGNQLNIASGDVICLAAGERGPIKITNIKGREGAPVIITNHGGIVRTTPYEYSIAIESSKWLRLTSTMKNDASYGIQLGGTLSVGQLSEQIEIDNLEIYRARFAGMLIKTDPNCNPDTWQENFTMNGISIHHNYIHHTEEGEGMYVGYTGKSRTLECNGEPITVLPHMLNDVHIYNNKLEQIAADGIQLNSVVGNATIENNSIYRTGVSPFAPVWQNSGIQVGGDNVKVSNNVIYHSGGNGLMLDGNDLQVMRNAIFYAGENGIFARNPAQSGNQMGSGLAHVYQDNLIVQSQSYGLKLYAIDTLTPHKIMDNTIENNGELDAAGRAMTFSFLNDSVLRELKNNHHYVVVEN
ncbi:right-handed parallel beta-helix repeat-containing protein [Thalassotalea ganghwensis]